MRKLLLAVLMLSFCVSSWAEVSSQDLRRTSSERDAEIERAIREIGGTVSEMDRVNFRDGLKKGEHSFMRLYNDRWKALGMSARLEKAVNDAIDDKKKEMMIGTAGLQLATNWGNVINDIQESIAFKFADTYDDFLGDLEEKWGSSLETEIAEFYRRASIMLIAADKNPMVKAYIRQDKTAQRNGERILEEVSKKLEARYPDLKLSGATAAGGIALIFRRQLTNYLARFAGKTVIWNKVAASAAGKLVGHTLPIIGWAMTLWTVYDVASVAMNAEDDVRKMLIERNMNMYSHEMPGIYWDVMEPYVMDVLVSSYGVLQNTRRQALEFADDPRIIELSRGLNDSEIVSFAERISSAVEILGSDKYDYVIENFGAMIKDASSQNFRRLMNVLQQENISQAKEWIDLAGTQYYDFYALFPHEVWEKYPPSTSSLELLSWMAGKLTPGARATASKLTASDLQWIIRELPERYVPQLFTGRGDESAAIHYEISRLSEISDKEARKPYMSVWEYRWAKYSLYVITAGVMLFVIVVLRLTLPLITMMFRRKSRSGDKSGQVIINVPPQLPQFPQIQPANIPPVSLVKKYDVKLRISPSLIDDIRRTQWDISQMILPSDNGTYIFSVRLESLDYLAWWVSRHKESIEVIQPDELRHIITEGASNS